MKFLDLTLPTPEENLACDEALLEALEEGTGDEVLRFWEAQSYFVVLGSSSSVRNEVHAEACRADGIPILRRHSGGATVMQGPGCLNYALLLKIEPQTPTHNITSTTQFVIKRHAEALSRLLKQTVEVLGTSDLTHGSRKFSGNAQRRKLKSLLFHGTMLLDFDLSLIEKYLKMPPKQPAYRAQRSHGAFLANITADRVALKRCLTRAWNAAEEVASIPNDRITLLVSEKYSREEWNFKF